VSTPVTARPTDKQFLGNSSSSKMEVHDLYNEKSQCQIDEIIKAGNAVTFAPDTLEQARAEGYDPCDYCLLGSTR
jgi:hypothetical protein